MYCTASCASLKGLDVFSRLGRGMSNIREDVRVGVSRSILLVGKAHELCNRVTLPRTTRSVHCIILRYLWVNLVQFLF
jgi:hypothetical protein